MPGARPVPARVAYAVDLLDPRPDDHVLEIGCGPGVAAALVCARLTTGRLLAIDRSPVALRRTSDRAAEHLAAGRLELRRTDLAGLDVEARSLDAAFAVNVNVFWTRDPSAELAVLRSALRSGAPVHLVYEAPGGAVGSRVVDGVRQALEMGGFHGVDATQGNGAVAISGRVG